jgi:hypothetical protein
LHLSLLMLRLPSKPFGFLKLWTSHPSPVENASHLAVLKFRFSEPSQIASPKSVNASRRCFASSPAPAAFGTRRSGQILSSRALIATITVLALMRIAPAAGVRTIPAPMSTPAARGMAKAL